MTPGVDFANWSVQYDNYTTDAGSCTTYVGNKTTEAANETGGGTEQLQGTINLKKYFERKDTISQNWQFSQFWTNFNQLYRLLCFNLYIFWKFRTLDPRRDAIISWAKTIYPLIRFIWHKWNISGLMYHQQYKINAFHWAQNFEHQLEPSSSTTCYTCNASTLPRWSTS